jgi:predicted RNase H-like HicB family nuclease
VTYKVKLLKTEEGFAVWCPTLPGCASQGGDEKEALENIREAIKEYLASIDTSAEEGEVVREVEVAA